MRTMNLREHISRRRRLRREQTFPEATLWSQLRGRQLDGVKFFRQFGVGPYVLDFYAPACRLAIELDGPAHFTDQGLHHDAVRTAYLNGLGIRVIRFTNEEILGNPNAVVERIGAAVVKRKAEGLRSPLLFPE